MSSAINESSVRTRATGPDDVVAGVLPVAAALALSVIGVLMFKILPLLVGSAATTFQLGPQQLGQLASSDLAGITLASLLAPLWVARVPWRIVARLALLLVAAGNVCSAAVDALPGLMLLRFLTGLGEGTASSLALAMLARTRNPDRGFGLAVGMPILFGLVAFQAFPPLVARWGFDGVVIALGALALGCLLLTAWVPATTADRVPALSPTTPSAHRATVAAALIATCVFHVGLGAVWAFIERIGVDAGLAPAAVSRTLGIAVVFGLAGAFAATAIGVRSGRVWPIVLAVGGQTLALLGLLRGVTPTTFLAVACAFQLLWLFCVPYQLGLIAASDRGGRLIVTALAFQAGGVTLGPIAGGALAERSGFEALYAMSACSLLASLAIFALASARLRTAQSRTA